MIVRKIVEMKKLYSGTYLFQSSIEVITYHQKPQGKPEPPFEKVRITFDNEQGGMGGKKHEANATA
ncbi:hypothetical protein GCM10020331_068980 [Ectobacillus funiculus]